MAFRINWALVASLFAAVGLSVVWGATNLFFIEKISSLRAYDPEISHYIHVVLHLCLLAVMIWLELALASFVLRWPLPPEFAIFLNRKTWLWWLCGPLSAGCAAAIAFATVHHTECIWSQLANCRDARIVYAVTYLPRFECEAFHVVAIVLLLLLVVRAYTWVFHAQQPPTRADQSGANLSLN